MGVLGYNLLLTLLSPLLLLFYAWRLAKGKEDRAHRGERWGRLSERIAADTRRPRFWVHAVSVGEVMAAAPVLRALRARWPDALIVVSNITPGGREVAQKQVPPADEVVYFPIDYPIPVRRALETVRPDAVILMEWEIWPNFLRAARRQGARIAVLNGRVSDRGLARGRRFAFLTRPGLEAVDRFAMQSDEDARRAALVGADPAKVESFGNTKFDEAVTPLSADERAALRADLSIPEDAPVWVCGSTRPGEEEIIAAAYDEARRHFPDLHLIVAPRHLERADEVERILRGDGRPVMRRSRQKPPTPSPSPAAGEGRLVAEPSAASCEARNGNDSFSPLPSAGVGAILLLDTFGELGRVYAVAGVAFVGGSLLPFGGQSVFQPLAQGTPALFGPYMNNQRDIAALAKASGVGFEVRDAAMLAAEVVRLLALEEGERHTLGGEARALIERNQGVAARCVEAVARLLGETVSGEAR